MSGKGCSDKGRGPGTVIDPQPMNSRTIGVGTGVFLRFSASPC
jgi:hypothetical protein